MTQVRFSLVIALGFATPVLAQPLPPAAVMDVVDHLVGVMETADSTTTAPSFVAVRMTTCEVVPQLSTPNTHYLYQEQALVSNLAAPYRQRFLQIALSDDQQRVESRTLKPEDPARWTGLCDQDTPEPIEVADMGVPVCTVALRPSALGYVGSTPTEGCPVTLRGATRLTNVIVLHAAGMDTWDRGFDAEGVQLWGAQAEPYRYRWVTD
ncbi:MAG: chromophore lyase CpcT/CpeT [Cyanobacteria bacterium P01_D01_bin.14]